jgi:hypothetical protein
MLSYRSEPPDAACLASANQARLLPLERAFGANIRRKHEKHARKSSRDLIHLPTPATEQWIPVNKQGRKLVQNEARVCDWPAVLPTSN